jgi:hypothetical protein
MTKRFFEHVALDLAAMILAVSVRPEAIRPNKPVTWPA